MSYYLQDAITRGGDVLFDGLSRGRVIQSFFMQWPRRDLEGTQLHSFMMQMVMK
jgi:hypothetical protein